MHTYKTDSAIFHYNSDLSGNVIISSNFEDEAIAISGYDLLEFVAEYIRSKK